MKDQSIRLEEIWGEGDDFRCDIKIAPLQLSTAPWDLEKLDQSGHFHHRKEVVHVYANSPAKVIEHTELFEEAKVHAENSILRLPTEAAKARQFRLQCNQVFISGQAGMGKTTLSKELIRQMLPPICLYNAKFIFYIKFRDLCYEKESDLLDFLTMYDSDVSSEYRQKLIKYLENCPDVYVVMDGLDEADIKLELNHPKCNSTFNTKPATFIKNLLSGNVFPHSKKIVTSRPRQLAHLSNIFLPSSFLVVNLLGLNDEGQQQICHDVCQDNLVLENEILAFIKSRPDLESFCYVPINAITTMRIFKETNRNEWNNLNSLTSILVSTLKNWFLHLQKLAKFQAKKIAEMAYEGFCNNKYHFDRWSLENAGIDIQNLKTFMTNVKFHFLDGSMLYLYFAHLVWLEFFVALKLVIYTDNDAFEKANVISRLCDDKYDMVTRFLFGLNNEKLLRTLLNIGIEADGVNSQADRQKCKENLKSLVFEKLSNFDGRCSNLVLVLPILGWIHEMRDDVFTEQASDFLGNTFSVGNGSPNQENQLLPTDVPCLNYILRCHKTSLVNEMQDHSEINQPETLALEVNNPVFAGNSFQYFMKELIKTTKINSNIKVSTAQEISY